MTCEIAALKKQTNKKKTQQQQIVFNFLTRCAARNLKPPFHIYKDVCDCKHGWFDDFGSFCKSRPISKRFAASETPSPFFLSAIFKKIEYSSKDVLTKMGAMSEDFWWKGNPYREAHDTLAIKWAPLSLGYSDVCSWLMYMNDYW